jgi:protein TonB
MRITLTAIVFLSTFQTNTSHAKPLPEYAVTVLRQITSRVPTYPTTAAQKCRTLTTFVKFKINSNGTLLFAKVLKSSGNTVADEAAIINVQRAQPFPPPPRHFNKDFVAPITFRPPRDRCPR